MTGEVVRHPAEVDRERRGAITGGRGATVWLTGFSGSGKSTIARSAETMLIDAGRAAYVLDGDNVRHGLNADLGFSANDRAENVRRVGEVARLMADAGLVVIASLISPYQADRDAVRAAHDAAGITFIEVHVSTPLEVCEKRDPKGLYKRARAGDLSGFTGVDDPYEPPTAPDLTLDATDEDPDSLARRMLSILKSMPLRRGHRSPGD